MARARRHGSADPAVDAQFQVLIVEDSEDDALLMLRTLRQKGYAPRHRRVDTREALRAELARRRWDLVITDHNLPGFSSTETLQIVGDTGLDIPVIIVSGAIGEEHAVAAMRAGARDYVMKDNLARLTPAIERELRSAEARRAQRDAQETVRRLAFRDALTNLLNRREFEERLRTTLRRARRKGSTHALCYLDLDQFKVINDTCGHSAGDELLRQLSRLLQGLLRKRDTLARLGGDEFGVLMEDCTPEHAERIARELCRAISEFRFVWEDDMFRVGASIGVALIGPHSESVAALMSAADTACYAAKDEGRNRVHVYRQDDQVLEQRHGEMQWVGRINRALEHDRLVLYYQPIISIEQGERSDEGGSGPAGGRRASACAPLHVELLLRMRDDDGGTIPPGAFLPAAERYSLASLLDRWVVGTALDWLGRRASRGEPVGLAAINLSGQSLGDNGVLEFICERLADLALPAGTVCFEITETAAIANLSSAIGFMQTLKQRGCQFSLDDFGSGLSSFGYLKTMPVDYLKIDGLFVRDIVDDPIDLAMVRSINEIGHVMGKKTIAEFVENDAILSELQRIGVDYAQGYGIGKPAPLAELD